MRIVSARGKPFTVTLSCSVAEMKRMELDVSQWGELPTAFMSADGDYRTIVLTHAPGVDEVGDDVFASVLVHETLHGLFMSWNEWDAHMALDENQKAVCLWWNP